MAEPVYHEKRYFADGSFQETKIWRVPQSKNKPHGLKYSFAYIVGSDRVVGYDNSEGKGTTGISRDKNHPTSFKAWINSGEILIMT